jgi:prenylcysteine oxidase/farnesylcysteine lyase
MKSVVGKFERMYEAPVFPWRSLTAVVRGVGLGEAVGQTGEQFLEAAGIGERFALEVIQARYVEHVLDTESGWLSLTATVRE